MNRLPFLVPKKWEAVHRPTGEVFRSVGTRRTRRSGPASTGSGSMRAVRLCGKKSPKSEGEGAAPPSFHRGNAWSRNPSSDRAGPQGESRAAVLPISVIFCQKWPLSLLNQD